MTHINKVPFDEWAQSQLVSQVKQEPHVQAGLAPSRPKPSISSTFAATGKQRKTLDMSSTGKKRKSGWHRREYPSPSRDVLHALTADNLRGYPGSATFREWKASQTDPELKDMPRVRIGSQQLRSNQWLPDGLQAASESARQWLANLPEASPLGSQPGLPSDQQAYEIYRQWLANKGGASASTPRSGNEASKTSLESEASPKEPALKERPRRERQHASPPTPPLSGGAGSVPMQHQSHPATSAAAPLQIFRAGPGVSPSSTHPGRAPSIIVDSPLRQDASTSPRQSQGSPALVRQFQSVALPGPPSPAPSSPTHSDHSDWISHFGFQGDRVHAVLVSTPRAGSPASPPDMQESRLARSASRTLSESGIHHDAATSPPSRGISGSPRDFDDSSRMLQALESASLPGPSTPAPSSHTDSTHSDWIAWLGLHENHARAGSTVGSMPQPASSLHSGTVGRPAKPRLLRQDSVLSSGTSRNTEQWHT